jgi:signal transduction histidine kinase/HAMP domain-containing protein
VATAVTKGDLTRSITAEALGELAELKDNINEMIRNLRDQTLKNTEQDWLKTNLARFTRMLQGERDLSTVSNMVLSELAPLVNAQHGVFYVGDRDEDGDFVLNLAASYAFNHRKHLASQFKLREGLVGQAAYEKSRILLTNVPKDYVSISSGLGEALPLNIIVLPAVFEGEVKAVIELATFGEFNETQQAFLDQLMESIGIVLNTIAANMRTEGLLKQSQLLTSELQSQQEELKKTNDRLEQQATTLRQSEELLRTKQEELQQTNAELEDKAQLLAGQNKQVEAKNHEVELAKRALEEKAEQLALTSKYKSEFLANMSHELRTPLNSLPDPLEAAGRQQPGQPDRQAGASSPRTSTTPGADLMGLINDILDLSKIESGTGHPGRRRDELRPAARPDGPDFRQLAHDKKLDFTIDIARTCRGRCTRTKNACSRSPEHAVERLQVPRERLGEVHRRTGGQRLERRTSDALGKGQVLGLLCHDTVIGLPEDKQR